MTLKLFAIAILVSLFFSPIEDIPKNDMDSVAETKMETLAGPPCRTAVLPLNTGGQDVNVYLGANLVQTFNSETAFNLTTNKQYVFDIPNGGTVSFCSCGDNVGSLGPIPFVILVTSTSSAPYTTCSF